MRVIAVEIGADSLESAVIAIDGSLSARRNARLTSGDFDEVVMQIVCLIQETALESGEVDGIGVAARGVYSASTGTVRWDGAERPLLDALRSHLSLPLEIESCRLAAMLGEQWLGAARDARDAIYFRKGSVLEAGILASGRLVRGAHDSAGARVEDPAALVEMLDPEVIILYPGFEFAGGVASPLQGAAALLGVGRLALAC